MSRRRHILAERVGTDSTDQGQFVYRGSLLVDPYRPPNQQRYCWCNESFRNRRTATLKNELELPLYQAFAEVERLGRYTSLGESLSRLKLGAQLANRLVVSLQISNDRFESNSLIANLIGLLIGFTQELTEIPDARHLTIKSTDYQLSLGAGRVEGDFAQMLDEEGIVFIKLFAISCDLTYDNAAATGGSSVLEEGQVAFSEEQVIGRLKRLASAVEQIETYRQRVQPEVERNLNNFLETQDPQSPAGKSHLADFVNATLKRGGMAIKCKNEPCYLSVTSGKKDLKGRFRLTPIGTSAHLDSPASLLQILPVELMPARVPRTPILSRLPEDFEAKWQVHVRDSVSPASNRSV